MTHVSSYAIVDAPNYGGRVPVDTAPGPVPVYRALKIPLTMSEHCNCGTNAVFCTPNHTAPVIAHNGHAITNPKTTSCNGESSAVSSTPALENCRTCTKRSRPPYQCTATGESLW